MREITIKQSSPAKYLMNRLAAARKWAANAPRAEKIRTAEIKSNDKGGLWTVLVDGKTLLEAGAPVVLHGVKNAGMAACIAARIARVIGVKIPPAIRQIAADYVAACRWLADEARKYNARLDTDPEFRLAELRKVEARRMEAAQKAAASAKSAADQAANAAAAIASTQAREAANAAA